MRRAALTLAVLLCAAAPAGAADLRRVESIGVVPIGGGAPEKATPRAAAVRAAVARAVEAVAQGLGPVVPPLAGSREAAKKPTAIGPEFARALGEDPLDYATRYRILEDRGVRPAPRQEGGADKEYVVVVEVQVDAARVAERLRAAGWLRGAGDGEARATLRLVLEGVSDYRALESIRRLLLERLGAQRALPVEFSQGRAVLAVEGGPPADTLVTALQAAAPPELRLVPVEVDAQSVALLVEWTPPPAPSVEPAADVGTD